LGSTKSSVGADLSSTILALKSFIDANLQKDLAVSRLCLRFGASESKLKQAFIKSEEISITEYIQQQRMALASELLKDSQMSILDICQNTGYFSPTSFSKLFSRNFGMSPNEYRKKNTQVKRVNA